MTGDAAVLVEQRGRLGLLTLNRPKAINALTHTMVELIAEAMDAWEYDDAIATVAVVGAGDRGLCAGGDVVSLYRDVTDGDGSGAAAFWRDEYALNARIARYPKPFVAIQDGIVLGGGIGVSAHGSHRVVTERSKLGFPEVTIGYIPDVGATWLLAQAPGELGVRLALTAGNVGPADAILVGFSDHFISSDRIPALLLALETEEPAAAIARLASEPEPGVIAAQRDWTDAAFGASSVTGILDRLRNSGDEAASALADVIARKSPLALAVTLEALRRARHLSSLEVALAQEYRVSRHSSMTPDFAEGIRAQLVDKDRSPIWQPAAHADVNAADVAAFFEAPPEGDLDLTTASASKETT
ncbi:enoyl-CoA hydratase/isomerase family protein [Agrococcus baldri]|uniref:3-hydroxyisobutyryl-CoA hydrolase n=1 Tax=Agrococcus baldri TaxID=153730 RepID=A0AA87RER4_9MICO|nr:enoyl-CoA hydratase/isomerase family protein [Agrococcus baldri]GEK79120.1 3-hydroxyisobutyryl-CoA hydrolase [Agrococcus baldri]